MIEDWSRQRIAAIQDSFTFSFAAHKYSTGVGFGLGLGGVITFFFGMVCGALVQVTGVSLCVSKFLGGSTLSLGAAIHVGNLSVAA